MMALLVRKQNDDHWRSFVHDIFQAHQERVSEYSRNSLQNQQDDQVVGNVFSGIKDQFIQCDAYKNIKKYHQDGTKWNRYFNFFGMSREKLGDCQTLIDRVERAETMDNLIKLKTAFSEIEQNLLNNTAHWGTGMWINLFTGFQSTTAKYLKQCSDELSIIIADESKQVLVAPL